MVFKTNAEKTSFSSSIHLLNMPDGSNTAIYSWLTPS